MTVGVARVNVCRVETGNIHRGKLIRHRYTEPEIRGVVADTLSRQVPVKDLKIVPEKTNNFKVMRIKMSVEYERLKGNFESMREAQLAEKWIRDKIILLERLATEVSILTKEDSAIWELYVIHEGLLFKRGDAFSPQFRLCIPLAQVKELVLDHHRDFGHFGKNKMYIQMRERFFWPHMQRHIRQLVSACDLCQKTKHAEKCHGSLNSVLPSKPGELVCTDLVGPLPLSRGGATQILVVVDAFSKYVKLYALKRATSRSILNKLLKDYFPEVQKPECILSDNGTQYTSKSWKKSLTEMGVQVKYTSLYFPEGNPTERYNREIGRMIRAYCHDKHTRWAYVLDTVEYYLNVAINDSTGMAPVYLQFHKSVPQPIDTYIKYPQSECREEDHQVVIVAARERLLSKAQRRASRLEKSKKLVTFREGDAVLVRRHDQSSAADKVIKKFFLLFDGPFWISKQVGPNSYILKTAEGVELPKQNVVNLRPYQEMPVELE
nr:unnamed protein product [Callosobruchus analis]